mgnify:CR=1 FL=1
MSINSNTNSWKCFVWQFHYIIKSLPWYARKLLGYKCRHEIQTLNNDHYIVSLPCCDIKLNHTLILKVHTWETSFYLMKSIFHISHLHYSLSHHSKAPHLDASCVSCWINNDIVITHIYYLFFELHIQIMLCTL